MKKCYLLMLNVFFVFSILNPINAYTKQENQMSFEKSSERKSTWEGLWEVGADALDWTGDSLDFLLKRFMDLMGTTITSPGPGYVGLLGRDLVILKWVLHLSGGLVCGTALSIMGVVDIGKYPLLTVFTIMGTICGVFFTPSIIHTIVQDHLDRPFVIGDVQNVESRMRKIFLSADENNIKTLVGWSNALSSLIYIFEGSTMNELEKASMKKYLRELFLEVSNSKIQKVYGPFDNMESIDMAYDAIENLKQNFETIKKIMIEDYRFLDEFFQKNVISFDEIKIATI